jgi:hypothetical protein
LRDRPNLGRLAGCCHPAPLHAATCSLRAPPIASAGPFGGISPPEQCAASWSCSSSRNPLGNCISARPETGLGPDSARTRFLSSRLAAQFLIRRTGTDATPSRGTGDICLSRLAPCRGRTHQLCPPFPRLPGLIPVAPSAGFSVREPPHVCRSVCNFFLRNLLCPDLAGVLSPLRVSAFTTKQTR